MSDYLIWSNVHQAWWRPENAGYTTDITEAGFYTHDEARSTALKCRDGWTITTKPTELAVAVADTPLTEREPKT